jgi:toxin HigB-1
MIISFVHKGLEEFFRTGSKRGVQPSHVNKLRMQLAGLESANEVSDMDVPGWRLHELKGQKKGTWAIWVNGNWRLTFKFTGGNAQLLDYEDYH